jgi:hypothetical protein
VLDALFHFCTHLFRDVLRSSGNVWLLRDVLGCSGFKCRRVREEKWCQQ